MELGEWQDAAMGYRLESLGPHDFERMIGSLLIAEYGGSVQVFSSGRDDGRDATFDGLTSPSTKTKNPTTWHGYHVFQSKFRESPLSSADARKWMTREVRTELRRWTAVIADGKEAGNLKRVGERPEYYIFVTNLELSGQHNGAIDALKKEITDFAKDAQWPMMECAVWDRTKIERLLDVHGDTRRAFSGLITPGDVLAALAGGSMQMPLEATLPSIEEHARAELRSGSNISMGETPYTSPSRAELSEVAVDLPIEVEGDLDPPVELTALRYIIESGNKILRPSISDEVHPHFLLMGGPGQGKTTLGRVLVQTYRAYLLSGRSNLNPSMRVTIDRIIANAELMGIKEPLIRRWPFRVDLTEYADKLQHTPTLSLIRYIADRISESVDQSLTADNVREWLRAWPWMLVLDGYDEVAAQPSRIQVALALDHLIEAASSADSDLLIVATTRPQGYGDELSEMLRKIHLKHLSQKQAKQLAARLITHRMGDDPEVGAVISRTSAAASDKVTGRLMRTPLQVMIMSLLTEAREHLPESRAELFASYYKTIYDREQKKPGHLSDILRRHKRDVDAIHSEVGLRLQKLAEGAGESEALMELQDLTKIITERLISEGHEGERLDFLSLEMERAAKDRLVLLAAQGKNQVGFELRSMQEFMAANSLIDRSDQDAVAYLLAMADSSYWRNTWLLAVGMLHLNRQSLFNQLLWSLKMKDGDDPLNQLTPASAELSLDILDDGVAMGSPADVRALTDSALKILDSVSLNADRLGDVLAGTPENYSSTIRLILNALDRAVKGKSDARRSATMVCEGILRRSQTGPLATRARQLLQRNRGIPGRAAGKSNIFHPSEIFVDVDLGPYGYAIDPFVRDLDEVLIDAKKARVIDVRIGESALVLLRDRDALQHFVDVTLLSEEDEWHARATVAAVLLISRGRIPIAPLLP